MSRILKFFVVLILVLASQSAPAITPYLPFFSAGQSAASAPIGSVTPAQLGATGWWEPSRGYSTNSGIATLSNLTSLGSSINFFQTNAAKSPVRQPAKLNGLDTILFSGGSYADTPLTSTYPFEVFMVFSLTNVGTYQVMLDGSRPAGTIVYFAYDNSLQDFGMYAALGPLKVSTAITNRYFVADLVYNSDSSAFYTNNVQGIPGNTGGNSVRDRFRLGIYHDAVTFPATYSLASIFIFTNRVLSASERLQAYQYATNRFAIAP